MMKSLERKGIIFSKNTTSWLMLQAIGSQHLRDAEKGGGDLQQIFCSSLIGICDISSNKFEIFYQASKETLWNRGRPIASLYVAAYLGLDLIVNVLLADSESQGGEQRKYGYGAALLKASQGGYSSIVRALLQHDAVLKAGEGHSLIAACTNGPFRSC